MSLVWIASLGLIVYAVAAYPLLLALQSRYWGKPIKKAPQRKSVSVIIAVHNGERFIAQKLESVLDLNYPRELMEVLVVSDGSTDRTDSIVHEFADRGVQLLQIPRGGKCAALNAGIPRTRNEILLLTDVRQTIAPDSLEAMIECFADPTVGSVSGDLLIRPGANSDEVTTGLYWKYESWIRRNLGRVDSIFCATGPFYAVRRELAVTIPPDILVDDMYLSLAVFFRGYRLVVEPRAKAFDYPTTRDVEFRRKVRTLAGNYQMLRTYPALLGPRDRMWFHFMSYKFARLLLPWAFAALLVSSFFLPVPLRWFAVGAQLFFYILAATDSVIPVNVSFKKLSSASKTFLLLLCAPVMALSVLAVPPRSLWRETKIGKQHS
jgi:poly-beta-1,6-N-acetyl-D-glucosamine synthase